MIKQVTREIPVVVSGIIDPELMSDTALRDQLILNKNDRSRTAELTRIAKERGFDVTMKPEVTLRGPINHEATPWGPRD